MTGSCAEPTSTSLSPIGFQRLPSSLDEMRDEMRTDEITSKCAGSVPQWMVAEDRGQSWGEFMGKD